MLKSAVCCALRFFEYAAGIVILVATLEPKAAIRSGNFRTGKTPHVIEFIANRLPKFAILPGGRGRRLMLCGIEIVNGARAVWVHRHSHPHSITTRLLQRLAESFCVATDEKRDRKSTRLNSSH